MTKLNLLMLLTLARVLDGGRRLGGVAPVTLIGRRRRHAPRWMSADRAAGERGDIPGWVMIAIMSAAVVVVLIPLVGPAVGHAFTNAINSVSNTKSGTP